MVTEKKLFFDGGWKLFDAAGDLSKRWFIYRSEDGKRVKAYGLLNRLKNAPERYAEAKRLAASLSSELKGCSTLRRLADDYLERPGTIKRTRTIKNYRTGLNHFCSWAETRNLDLDTVTPTLAQSYIAIANASYAQTVRGLFNMAVELHYLTKSPFEKISRTYDHKSAPRINDAHRKAILDWLKQNRYDVYMQSQIMYNCFVRCAEQIRLKPSAFDFETGTIYINSDAAKCAKRPRRAIIPNPFLPELKQYIESLGSQEWLFLTKHNVQHIRIDYFNDWIERACKSLDIKERYTTYSFRHSSAIKAVMKGISVRQLQMQMGHASLDMTGRYLRQMGWQDMDEMRGGW